MLFFPCIFHIVDNRLFIHTLNDTKFPVNKNEWSTWDCEVLVNEVVSIVFKMTIERGVDWWNNQENEKSESLNVYKCISRSHVERTIVCKIKMRLTNLGNNQKNEILSI